MFRPNLFLGLLFVISAVQANPVINADDSQNDGLVYVFNIYAVRNMKTREVAKMMDQKPLEKVSAKFDPIGTFMIADPDDNEPFTLEEFGEFVEQWGAKVEKLNEGKELKVIELKFEDMDYYDEVFDIEAMLIDLRAEGAVIKMTIHYDTLIFEIELDETVIDLHEHEVTLKQFVEYLQGEGYNVEAIGYDGVIKSIKVTIDLSNDDSEQDNYQITEKSNRKNVDGNDVPQQKDERSHKTEISVDNAIDRTSDKNMGRKDEHYDDKINMINFITSTRKRRSADICATPECRVGNLIKEIVNKYERAN